MEKLLILLIVLCLSSCSTTRMYNGEPCRFVIYEDKFEIYYYRLHKQIVVEFKEGEDFNKAYKRYYRELRHGSRRNDVCPSSI